MGRFDYLRREAEIEYQRQQDLLREQERKKSQFIIPALPKPEKPDDRRPIEITTKSSHTFSGVPLYSQVTDEAYFNFPKTKKRGRRPEPTGNVKFYLCEEEDLEPGGPRGIGGGCPIGKGKLVDTSYLTKHKDSWMSVSDTTIADQVGKYCWRAEYSGDENFKSAIHTTPSLKDECFITTRTSQVQLPEGYKPPLLKRRPPGRPRVITIENAKETIKNLGIVTPTLLKDALDLRDESEALEYISKVESEEFIKHPIKDEWRYRPKQLVKHFEKLEEKELERRIRLEKEIQTQKIKFEEKVDGSNIEDPQILGIDISTEKRKWDTTKLFTKDIKRIDFNLQRALERRIDRILDAPERGSQYGSTAFVNPLVKSLILSQCPTHFALHANVTGEYRILWCNVGDRVRFLRLFRIGDPEYDIGSRH